MRQIPFRAVILLVLCASAAVAADVKSDYDRSFNLANLRTFRFSDQSRRLPNDALASNELVTRRLHAAIHDNLLALGMEQQDGQVDFEIA